MKVGIEMKVLVLEPMKHPYVKEISGGLQSIQDLVGGYFQAIFPSADDAIAMCLNEEGKLIPLPRNRALTDSNGNPYDCIYGTAFIAGVDGSDLCSLPEPLIEKYTKLYFWPDVFIEDPSTGCIIVRPATEAEIC